MDVIDKIICFNCHREFSMDLLEKFKKCPYCKNKEFFGVKLK